MAYLPQFLLLNRSYQAFDNNKNTSHTKRQKKNKHNLKSQSQSQNQTQIWQKFWNLK